MGVRCLHEKNASDLVKDNEHYNLRKLLLTPKQVLGMEDVGNTRIKEPPRYIKYQ
jgi:hypothetical protein